MTTGNQSQAATRLRPGTHTMAGARAPRVGTASGRGGYGHGLAADVVSVKGDTRSERCSSSERMWKWIDTHDKEFGIGRPYLDKDPPHIAPIDGKEYADKRGVNMELADKGSTATGRDVEPATFQE